MNNAATLLHMSGGQFNVPIVIRMTTGAGRQLAAQHSHSLEGWYAHIPGLRILTPATVDDARWMLGPALRDPDPVLIFEHVGLYNVGAVLERSGPDPDIDHARIRRPGLDVSIVSYGGGLPVALTAADELAGQHISAEVIDLRVLRPLDERCVLDSVTRTHRLVVVDEGWRSGSLSAEVAARVAEHAFYELDAPIERVCSAEVPIPYARALEEAARPRCPDVVAAVLRAVS
jgi:pyruvate dehydrogenase E1 component beta subunit